MHHTNPVFPLLLVFMVSFSEVQNLSADDLLNKVVRFFNIYQDAPRGPIYSNPNTPDNGTIRIPPGLPGTQFQPIAEQNIADKCIPLSLYSCNGSERYRTIDGACNNLFFPMWAQTGTALVRLLPASYQDGDHEPRLSLSGKPLPNPRLLRKLLLPNGDTPDEINTRLVMEWGQIVSHDTTHISLLPVANLEGIQCCENGHIIRGRKVSSRCDPIHIPEDDPYFSQYNQTCMNFVRALTTTNLGCDIIPQQQMAMVSQFIDASWVYGSNALMADLVRERIGGRLKVQLTQDGRQFPPNVKMATHDCHVQSNSDTCYFGGDTRINQNTDVTILHVLFLREHNRLCGELASLNPHWADERIYQEARRILIAAVQRITYSDFLLVLLGQDYGSRIGILDSDFDEQYNGYISLLNPTSVNEFTAAAYRALHNLVPSTIELTKSNGCPMRSLLISDWYFTPSVVQDPGNFDELLRGLATQPSNAFNTYFSPQVSNKLFRLEAPYGADLAAVDIQRSRDHGIAPYNEYRVACGFPRAVIFSDFSDLISESNIKALSEFYDNVDDVELYVAGLMERRVDGALTGPTFQCIIGEQFFRWRNGDRYYYLFSNQSGSFTSEQFQELRKLRLSLIICRDGDNVQQIQPNVFLRPNSLNPVVPCSQLPQLNLEPWREI